MELEPDPREWLAERSWQEIYESQLNPATKFLQEIDCIDKVITFWIRKKIIEQATSFNSANNVVVDPLDTSDSAILLPLLKSFWSKKVESLFLRWQRKLDTVTCNYLILNDKAFSLELYHRIKAKEITFSCAIDQYGQKKNNKNKYGILKNQSLADLPYGLDKVLKKMAVGQIFPPLRLNDNFCIVEMLDLKRASLDETSMNKLMFMALDEWIVNVQKVAKTSFE